MSLLTEKELHLLTGAKQTERQKRILDDNGIYYIERMDKSIVTTWYHVNHPVKIQANNRSEPNFGAIGNG